MNYYGIVIEQSLKNPDIINEIDLVAQKQKGSWNFLLLSIPENELENQLKKLQNSMIHIDDECWYSHFFRDESMIVVYQDALFKTTVNPNDWKEVITYGINHGVPIEQLDFDPHTKKEAFNLFEL